MSEFSNDVEEFMELAGGEDGDDDFGKRPSRPRAIDDEDDDAGVMKGTPTQWAHNGGGLAPMTQTKNVLPPDLYDLQYVNDVLTFVPTNLVTDKLLRLPDSRSDEVISEIERFWTLKDRFKKFGFTHKRGFLLYGPPGSGKTSTISFIIKQMINSNGLALLANMNPDVVSSALKVLRKIEPERKIVVVMEDLDTIIATYGESEVLSILDGESSVDNCVFLATTNYPENLDGRIVNRPSRFDRVVKIGMPNEAARKAYLVSRELNLSDTEMKKWVEATKDFSIAHIKELIVGVYCYGNDFTKEVERLKSMAKKPKSDSEGETGFRRK